MDDIINLATICYLGSKEAKTVCTGWGPFMNKLKIAYAYQEKIITIDEYTRSILKKAINPKSSERGL